MKTAVFFTVLVLVPAVAAGQSQTRERRSTNASTPNADSSSFRDRTVTRSNHVDAQKVSPDPTPNQGPGGSPAWGNTAVTIQPPSTAQIPSAPQPAVAEASAKASELERPLRKLTQPTSVAANAPGILPGSKLPARTPVAPTSAYNVGVGDVLDVRLLNLQTRESTLFTVMKNGTLEYPLLSGPVSVAGLTTDEIAYLLSSQIKVIQGPKVTVSVRDYASHAVVISGAVDSPGRKILRREAMPLYTVLAEALPRPEASAATIVRQGKEGEALPLNNQQAMATVVIPGDVIKISSANSATQFLYVGGEVASPGEKNFREGMTLTQALLSAGGASRPAKTVVRVARRNINGFLSTTEYVLSAIEQGKSPDPLLQPGDRLDVASSK